MKMTPAMRKALGKWWVAQTAAAPHVLGVRNDVARKLFEAGYLTPISGGGFRAGVATLRITPAGEAAVSLRD